MAIDSYHRFYALLRRLPGADKEELVSQFTGGRTTHLHLMAGDEYRQMCDRMEQVAGLDERSEAWRREMRRLRSAALHQMQLLGVDTASWAAVDRFCQDRRIAGLPFRLLDAEALERLTVKLRAIRRKRESREPGLRLREPAAPQSGAKRSHATTPPLLRKEPNRPKKPLLTTDRLWNKQ